MRKISLCLAVTFTFLLASPLHAMEFYQAENGTIVLQGDSCQDAAQIARLIDDDNDPTSTDRKAQAKEEEGQQPRTFHEQEFTLAQAKLIAFVRDINWKTGFNLTLRDMDWISRLKVICTGVWNYTKPFRVELEAYDADLDEHFQELEDAAFSALATGVTDATFHKAAKLSLTGVYNAMITTHPFLLLVIDEDTYNSLVEKDSQIQELADNMYQFFVIRSVYMDESYNKNTKELLRISKIGKGNALSTWALFAQFASKTYDLDKENKLTVDTEKSIHIWKLNAMMEKVRRQVEIEKRAAKIALKDPNYQQWLDNENKTNPKKPSLNYEAQELLKRSTEREIKALINKYYGQ